MKVFNEGWPYQNLLALSDQMFPGVLKKKWQVTQAGFESATLAFLPKSRRLNHLTTTQGCFVSITLGMEKCH